jgi:phosphoribosylanthranilate isomerase
VIRVKICGITRTQDAVLAADLGAAAIGFVFWPRSPRFVEPLRARDIVAALPPFVTPVGVFVDQPAGQVRDVAALVGLGAVQLNGGESLEYLRLIGRPAIKAASVAQAQALREDWPADVALLLDAVDDERRGGTGRTVDWAAAAVVAAGRRIILAGGLRPENVVEAIRLVRPFAVDASSGVEAGTPGVKDAGRLRSFFAAVTGAAEGAAR